MKTLHITGITLFAGMGLLLCTTCDELPLDRDCGDFNSNAVTIYKKTPQGVDSAYYGISGDQVIFMFVTPDWLDTMRMCSKEHAKAAFEIDFNSYELEKVPNLKITAEVHAGGLSYPVEIKWATTHFEGSNNDIGLNGWQPFADSGIAFVWAKVNIAFDTSHNVATDVANLKTALMYVGVTIRYSMPKAY